MTSATAVRTPVASRLFAAGGARLTAHHQRFGELPADAGADLAALLDAAGLTGRGGAGFPTGRKLSAVTGRHPVAVGNGAEGEPLSGKDAVLLARAPHLVLDGLQAAAAAVAARDVYLYLPSRLIPDLETALDERGTSDTRVRLVPAPDAFVAGEESAVVRRIEGGPALPRDRVKLTAVSGVRGRPTLVSNVETLAHIALIVRYGARWFRSVGDAGTPGTMLVTVTGAGPPARVLEVPTGAPLASVIGAVGHTGRPNAVLVGGYHGTWVPGGALAGLRLSRAGLAGVGASPGAGIVHVLGGRECGLIRTADIVAYLAGQGARQCGPCANGLPRLAGLLGELAGGGADRSVVAEIERICGLVDGRGSCRHPDGTVRLVRSAMTVFGGEVALHLRGRCHAGTPNVAPSARRWRP